MEKHQVLGFILDTLRFQLANTVFAFVRFPPQFLKTRIMSQDPLLTIQNFFTQSHDIPVNSKWDTLWNNSITPWDRGLASPALVELLVNKHFSLLSPGTSGKALVPGCGKGYDVALFASLTNDDQKIEKAVGLDVSPKALEEARKVHQNVDGHVEFVLGDFFSETEDWAVSGPYDVVYDYTVFYNIFFLLII
jgi:SAM-dependent methyltransferase